MTEFEKAIVLWAMARHRRAADVRRSWRPVVDDIGPWRVDIWSMALRAR